MEEGKEGGEGGRRGAAQARQRRERGPRRSGARQLGHRGASDGPRWARRSVRGGGAGPGSFERDEEKQEDARADRVARSRRAPISESLGASIAVRSLRK